LPGLDQRHGVLWKAGSAESGTRVQEFRADTIIEPDPSRDFLNIGADFFRQIRDLVDKGDLGRKKRICRVFVVVALSLVINRGISSALPYRDRPMYSIGANAPTFEWHADLEHWSSFPSDNATYLFAIAASLWLISRRWGLLFGVFAAFAALARVFLGIHYPSDIVVGALIGIVTSVVFNREMVRKRLAAPVLAWEARYPPYFYGLFFLALAEMSGGFPNTRRIGVAIVHLFVGYGR